ncbi:Alpha-(1-_3)-arabinofuranosyltransferase [Mycobacterium persicum]|uniref:Alpha-(1->3)-arabinofuranosyltransferase n=1 Tax=Mycobacterium persicum TaxID=1487726 RepID=A0AB38UM86_9MYCO|nr:Alpha-(1->3)-arabinofuranosyltransferase [Mycobacterium persicum]
MTPLSRRWLLLVAAVSLTLTFAQSPGRVSPDTKLDLIANPLRFLARATNLWNSELPFGQSQNQAYGYLFPHGTFFLVGHLLGVPGWLTQRLWWAVLLTVGFWGLLRVAEALGIGSPASRVIGAAAFALSPRVLTTLGSISSETLPMMLAPWVLLPTILALRGTSGRSVRALAAQAGVAVALMGAVNAIATLAGCLPAVIWLACHRPNRLWWRYTAWWLLALVLATLWWVVSLTQLRGVSPPFLDFIESSGVTTQWSSLVEVLRGTDSWTPFVAPDATAGAPLVTGSVAILGTCLVAAAGLAGLASPAMPARGRLVAMLLVGVVLLAVGYGGGLGSPLAHQVQAFLDAGGTPLRNVHKVGPVIRLPLVLGIAGLLGRIPLPGSVPRSQWLRAVAHPERDKRVAVGIVVLTAMAVSTSLAWTARLTPPGTFTAIPRYWQEAADWLSAHNTGTPTPGRVLVVPGAPFATQVWGTSHDEPLQVLGSSPWGVRDSIPLTPPQTIRALDSVQRLFAAGRPSAGLADTLARQGISYLVLRNDLDPETSRSARPILVHRAIAGSPGLAKVAEFGAPVGPGSLAGFVSDSGLRPRYPAVEIYQVGGAGAPYLVDTDRLPRVDGGPEVLLRLDERRRLSGQPALGPVLLTADAVAAGLTAPLVTVTDTPVARETDYGRVDQHSSAIRAPGDARHTYNRVPDYPVPGADVVYGGWTGGRRRAVAAGGLRSSGGQRRHHPDTECDRRRRADPAHPGRDRHRQHHPAVRRGRQAAHRGAALRRNAVGAGHRGRHRRRVCRGAVRYHRSGDHPVRRVRVRPPGAVAPHRVGTRAAGGFDDRALGPGVRIVGPAGLRARLRQRALRRVDGPGARGARQLQPHAHRAAPDDGDPDGVGAAQAGAQTCRSDR